MAGRLVSTPDGSVALLVDGTERVLPLTGVDSLWTKRSHGGHGALLLGGIGTVGGLILGAAINGICKGDGPGAQGRFRSSDSQAVPQAAS